MTTDDEKLDRLLDVASPPPATDAFKARLYTIPDEFPQARQPQHFGVTLPQLLQPAVACACALMIGIWVGGSDPAMSVDLSDFANLDGLSDIEEAWR